MHISLKKLSKKIFLFAMLAVIAATQGTQVVQAIDTKFFTGNDILFYDPDATCVPGTAGSLVGGSGENPPPDDWPKTVWGFLLGKGLSPAQAAGVMGNLQQESTNYRQGTSNIGKPFNPDATEFPGENKGGYGLMQWTGGRRDALTAAAAKQGVPVSSLAFQLEFLFQESNSRKSLTIPGKGEWDGLKSLPAGDIRAAAVYWLHNAERPLDAGKSVEDTRTGYGERWFNEFNGKVSTTDSAKCGVIDNSSLLATVKSYAWPEYHPPVYVTAKPEYVTALNRARSEGRYIGGTKYAGIDCGGFVTTVMFDSGFEKAYNYDAKGGNTESQKRWLDANWQQLPSPINPSDLTAGDVAMLPGHTYMYIGDKGNKPEGFGSVIASASWDERAPMAGTENPTGASTTWYRKKAPNNGGGMQVR